MKKSITISRKNYLIVGALTSLVFAVGISLILVDPIVNLITKRGGSITFIKAFLWLLPIPFIIFFVFTVVLFIFLKNTNFKNWYFFNIH